MARIAILLIAVFEGRNAITAFEFLAPTMVEPYEATS